MRRYPFRARRGPIQGLEAARIEGWRTGWDHMRESSKLIAKSGEARVIRTAGLAAVMLAAATAPAFAGRPLVADFDPNAAKETPFAGCALDGSVCNSVTDLDSAAFHYAGLDKVYVYADGIISLGAPLPSTARLEGGTASFGDGTWFAPGLGSPLMIEEHEAINRNQWFDWLDAGGHIVFQLDFVALQPCQNAFCYTGAYASYGSYWNPQDTALSDFGASFNGPGRGLIAFNLVVPPGQQQGLPACGDPKMTSLPDGPLGFGCSAQLNNDLPGSSGTPEPASWALMIIGFATVGSLLRGRRRVEA